MNFNYAKNVIKSKWCNYKIKIKIIKINNQINSIRENKQIKI